MVVPLVDRSLTAVAGALLVFTAWLSVIGTLIMSRPIGSWLTRWVDRIATGAFRLATSAIADYQLRHRVLAGQAAEHCTFSNCVLHNPLSTRRCSCNSGTDRVWRDAHEVDATSGVLQDKQDVQPVTQLVGDASVWNWQVLVCPLGCLFGHGGRDGPAYVWGT